jgi:hypothetical protein
MGPANDHDLHEMAVKSTLNAPRRDKCPADLLLRRCYAAVPKCESVLSTVSTVSGLTAVAKIKKDERVFLASNAELFIVSLSLSRSGRSEVRRQIC